MLFAQIPLTLDFVVCNVAHWLFQFDRQSSIRYSSRRARTLESLASLYEVRFVPVVLGLSVYFFDCMHH